MIHLPTEPTPGKPVSALFGSLIVRALRALVPRPSMDIEPEFGMGGVKFRLTPRTRKVLEITPKPFQILSLGKNAGGEEVIGVNYFSAIFKSLKVDDKMSISSLLTTGEPTADDAGAFAVPNIGDKIWVQIGTADPDATDPNNWHPLTPWQATTQIQYGPVGPGNLWDEYPDPVSINSSDDPARPWQEFYNLLIAECTDFDTDDRPALLDFYVNGEHRQITQMYSKNVLLTTWADGMAIMVPVDPTLDYVAT